VSRPDGQDAEASESLLGLAHVASCSFLAARLAPSLQFWAALGGGLALAQAAARHGLRAGYGASVAAVVQTVALIGPARVNGPLTQALNAPVMGRLQAKGAPRAVRLGAGLAIRLAHYAVLNVLFVVLVVGGLDEYVATYDRVAGFLRVLPKGTSWAVGLTILSSLLFGLFYTTIQLLVYERAFANWPEHPAAAAGGDGDEPSERPERARLPVVSLALTAAAWIALLISTAWVVLAAVAAGLAVATLVSAARTAGRDVWGIGLALSAVLAIGAMGPAIIGAVEVEGAAQRAVRAALLVLSATWLRAVAGAPGMREAARRSLRGVRRLPSAREAAQITEGLESDRRLVPAARAFLDELNGVPQRPGPLADALVAWVASEAAGYRPPPPTAP
jgi:hypothetical protein